jgi:hypothetical protein
MGMFDELTIDYPLPDIGTVDWKFQTKSFENELAHYHITTDGELQLLVRGWLGEWEAVDRIPVTLYGEPYHGYVEFHDLHDDTGVWYQFRAKFTDGKLVRIDTVEIRLADSHQ